LIDLLQSDLPEIIQFRENADLLSNYGVEVRYPDDFYLPSLSGKMRIFFPTMALKFAILTTFIFLPLKRQKKPFPLPLSSNLFTSQYGNAVIELVC